MTVDQLSSAGLLQQGSTMFEPVFFGDMRVVTGDRNVKASRRLLLSHRAASGCAVSRVVSSRQSAALPVPC
jgi:hypothetical protein